MSAPVPRIPVCTAAEAAALDRAAIDAGTPGRVLMARAGAAAAGVIAQRHAAALERGLLVLAGAGNNGGDGWVVARALHASGVRVRVWESEAARTPDAAAERALALAGGVPLVERAELRGEGVVVDAMLGTGATGAVRESLLAGVRCCNDARARGAVVVSVDMPTGVDASTGACAGADVVSADTTITFGAAKRGHLVARDACGAIVVVDIGLPAGDAASLPTLVSGAAARAMLPPTPADAHKGSNGRVLLIGGGEGMAGAMILAARGALQAGAGLVKVVAHGASLDAIRCAVPQALTSPWPHDADAARELAAWASAIAIGPGLGTSPEARDMLEQLLGAGEAPAVLDADALNLLAGDASAMKAVLRGRSALLTPHPAEMMRLAGAASVQAVLDARFDVGARLAADVGAAVLLKGVPTVIAAPDGQRLVVAAGTPALATGGSGDVLTGIAATLIAQLGDPLHAGAAAAWAHGRAAELATRTAGTSRGVPLDDVVAALAHTVWGELETRPAYPVLLELARP